MPITENNITLQEVNEIATGLIRKYDWSTEEIKDGVRLTVTDGNAEASEDITTGENIEEEISKLIKAVDEHEYTIIG